MKTFNIINENIYDISKTILERSKSLAIPSLPSAVLRDIWQMYCSPATIAVAGAENDNV